MKNKKVILFDLDGTLVDTDLLIIEAYVYMFKKYRPDYPLSLRELVTFLGPTLANTFPKYFKEDVDMLIKDYVNFTHLNQLKYATLYPNVIKTLTSLKEQGYILGVVTSKFYNSAKITLDSFNLTPFFEVIVSLNDVKNPKPDPEGILLAADKLKVSLDNIIYIGDNYSDFLAAKNAGVKVGLVDWSLRSPLSICTPDFTISRYNELGGKIKTYE